MKGLSVCVTLVFDNKSRLMKGCMCHEKEEECFRLHSEVSGLDIIPKLSIAYINR